MENEFFLRPEGRLRHALRFRTQKLNAPGAATQPARARVPTPRAGDFCRVAAVPLEDAVVHPRPGDLAIEAGPVPRPGAPGPVRPACFRDPDGSPVEICEYP